jgi:hypothetical protein
MMDGQHRTTLVRIASALGVFSLSIGYALLMLAEWWRIAVSSDQAHVADYHFGSESMIAHGGWQYASPALYAWTAFAEAVVLPRSQAT